MDENETQVKVEFDHTKEKVHEALGIQKDRLYEINKTLEELFPLLGKSVSQAIESILNHPNLSGLEKSYALYCLGGIVEHHHLTVRKIIKARLFDELL